MIFFTQKYILLNVLLNIFQKYRLAFCVPLILQILVKLFSVASNLSWLVICNLLVNVTESFIGGFSILLLILVCMTLVVIMKF